MKIEELLNIITELKNNQPYPRRRLRLRGRPNCRRNLNVRRNNICGRNKRY